MHNTLPYTPMLPFLPAADFDESMNNDSAVLLADLEVLILLFVVPTWSMESHITC